MEMSVNPGPEWQGGFRRFDLEATESSWATSSGPLCPRAHPLFAMARGDGAPQEMDGGPIDGTTVIADPEQLRFLDGSPYGRSALYERPAPGVGPHGRLRFLYGP
jgi:hypothetical protein